MFSIWLLQDEGIIHDPEDHFGAFQSQMTTGNRFAEAWILAQALDSQGFKNWLVSVATQSFDFWPWNLWELGPMLEAGFAASIPVRCFIEDLAYRLTRAELSLAQAVKLWYEEKVLISAGPELLVELLGAMEVMAKLKDTGDLLRPFDYVCSKWHIHNSDAERNECTGSIDVEEPPSALSSDTIKASHMELTFRPPKTPPTEDGR